MVHIKKAGKRLLSSALSLAMLTNFCNVLPISGFAEGESNTTQEENSESGHRYQLFDESKSWTDAEAYCESLGGHLVTINSVEEQNYINTEIMPQGTKKTYFIGLSRDTSDYEWRWVTGEEFDYTNWDDGEPNHNDENYVHMYGAENNSIGKWNNTYEDASGYGDYDNAYCGFICEWEDEDSPIAVENKMKHYALYSASDTVDLGLYGWGSSVNGNIYTGASFICSGSEMAINGRVDAVGSVGAYGWHIDIDEQNENAEPVDIIDYDKLLHTNAQPYDYYPESPAYIEDNNIINKSVKASGDVVISGTTFEGDCYIIADGNITYNVDTFETSGRVFLYSRNGNVIIKGTNISINGGIFAPHGKVSISSNETVLTGFIWADSIAHSGSRLTVNGSNFDLLEPRSVVKTYTVDDDFSQGEFSGLGLSVPDELTLGASDGEASPADEAVYGVDGKEQGVKVTYSSDKSFISGSGDTVNLKYGLSGYGEASDNSEPVDLVIVVDNSGSMRGDRIERTKASCKQIISQMKPNDRCAVVSFSDCSDILQDLTSDKELLSSAVDRFYTDGGTWLFLGLYDALGIFKNQSDDDRQKYIILLSDGECYKEDMALYYAEEAGQKNIRIFSLKVGNNTYAMQKMAINSNGVYKNAPDNKDIMRMMSSFASEVFNAAGRNTVFRTTVKDAASVDISAITPAPSAVTENEDGSVSLEWRVGSVALNDQKEINIPVTITSDTDGFADILENTSCVYYDSSGKANVVYTEDVSIPVSEYTESGNWTVIFDGGHENIDWDNIYWNGKRYGDGDISVHVSASEDGESFSEPVKAENNVSFSGVRGRYAKISVDMTVSSDGRSPELYDITIVSKDAVSENLTNTAPTAAIISKDRTKVNIPLGMRASVTDDCMDSDISVTWSCDDENVSFSDESGCFTSVIFSVNGSYDIICTVSDGDKTYQCVKTIVCEPVDSYSDIDPEQQQESEAPSISVMFPQFADRGETISAKIELLNNADISWYSAILNDDTAADVAADGSFSITMPETDGVYNLVVRAYDWSGRSDVKSFDVTVDGSAAAVNIMPSIEEAPVDTQAYFKVSIVGQEKISELSYTLNGEAVTVPEDGILPIDTSSEKEYVLEAHGTTIHGKELNSSAKLTVVMPDTEKPVVSISTDKADYIEGDNAVITVSATDNAGVVSMTVLLNGVEIQPDSSGKYVISDLRYGDYIITANAYDESGNMGTATRKITARDVITPAVTLKTDKSVVTIGSPVNITVIATDNSGTVHTELTVNGKPLALSDEGTAVFTPSSAGSYVIKALATDPSGNPREAEVTVEAVDPDTIAPDVNIIPDKETYFENDDISFTVEATDNIGVVMTAVFVDGEEVALSEDNTYTISNAELRAYRVTALAFDAEGNYSECNYIFNVNQEHAPEISVSFDKDAYKKGDYLKGLVTVQAQTDIISLTATVNDKPLRIEDGEFSLTDLDAGEYIFTFTARDSRELVSTVSRTVSVAEKEHITDEKLCTVIDGLVRYGTTTVYKVIASDDIDRTTIEVTLNGNSINLSDDLTYLFTGDKLFENVFVLTARTTDGELLTVTDTVMVYENDKPVLNVEMNKENDIHDDEDVIVTVSAEDVSGIKRIMCVFDGAEIPVDENGQVFLGKLDYKPHTLVIRAWDNFSNLRTNILTFYVVENEGTGGISISTGSGEEPDTKLLNANIITPSDYSVISCPTFIIGNAGGTDFSKYELTYQPAEGGEETVIKESTSVVNGNSLGEFDTTMLRNGMYIVRLTVWGNNGEVITDEELVSVEGQMKIGNFSLAFRDMTLNAGAVPLTLVRGYDSRDRNISGDFGFGWSNSISGASVTTSCELGSGWSKTPGSTSVYTADRPHIVSINWGSGQIEKFAMKVTDNGFASYSPVSVSYVSMGKSGSTLHTDIDGYDWTYDAGNILAYDDEWNETDYDPQVFVLTKKDGSVYTFRKNKGLIGYRDTNGNTLQFSDSEVICNNDSSKTISYTRDSSGRITEIASSSGKTVSYGYDENGDLVTVTDMSGKTTSFEYTDHYLTAIIDPEKVTVSRNIYDDDGRLIRTIDANDNVIVYDHDIEGREETVTDRNGGTTLYVYDQNGNIISQTDPMGNTVKSTYDSNGYMTSKTDAMGNVTTYVYDESGSLCSLTDAEGNTVTNGYNTKGLVTSINAMGIDVLKVNYDDKGNTTSTEDALGNVISYTYDNKGELTSVTDEIGTYMIISYDSNGNAISVTDGADHAAEFEYDKNGNCVSKTLKYRSEGVERTVTEHYVYDSDDNLIKIIDSNGNITSTIYNSMGKVSLATDEKGRQTSYEYDDLGNLKNIIYADGTSESFTYDNEGNNLTATDRLGRTVTMKYDKVGNLLSKTYPNGAVVRYTYNDNYELISTVSASGNETKYEYDRIGRNTAIIDALDNRTEFTYNDHSQLESMTDAKGNTYTYSYDDNGNRISTEYPDNSTSSVTYDARGRVTSRTDQHGYTTTYTYDGADRLTGVTDVLGNTTRYTYDEVGNLIKVTDAKEHSTTYTYDDLGRVVKTTNALGKTAEATYDVCGNILTSTDFGGKLTEYTYDDYDRLISKETADGTVSFSYTPDGKLSSVTDGSGITRYTYDEMDGLSKVVYPDGSYVSYSYDDAGRLTSINTAPGATSYEYDKLDRLVRVVDRNGFATQYEYDANGNRSAVIYANGIVVSYNYDELNRLISEKALDKQGGVVAEYEYTLGAAGERLKAVETDRTVEYTYDKLYRLTGEKITVGDEVTEYTYAYDSVSNRITKTRNSAETTYTYNALNQLTAENGTSYQYDDAGNLISVTSDTKSVLYAYNAENKMIRATVQEGNSVFVEEYEYDYAGNRTAKKSENDSTYYLNDVSGALTQVLAELDAEGNEKCWYTIGADLISQERNGAVSTYLYDGHGSVRGLSDDTGAVTDTYNYDAWGELLDKTGTTENSFLYCGEQLDSATGLYYLRARYMDPSTGTFTTMDTYAGSIFDPVSLHKYLYANANPVTYVDPSGYNSADAQSLNVGMTVNAIVDKIVSFADSVVMNIYRGFMAMRTALPAIIAASSSIALLVVDSPEFADLISRVANGELSVYNVSMKIQEYILQAQKFSEPVNNAVKNASGSGGSSGSLPPNDPDFWNKVKEAVDNVSNRFKKWGKCDKFKDAFTEELKKEGIDYKVIKVEPRDPFLKNIYSDKYGGIIGDMGFHYGVEVEGVVYDNLTTEGMLFSEWINDFGGKAFVKW